MERVKKWLKDYGSLTLIAIIVILIQVVSIRTTDLQNLSREFIPACQVACQKAHPDTNLVNPRLINDVPLGKILWTSLMVWKPMDSIFHNANCNCYHSTDLGTLEAHR